MSFVNDEVTWTKALMVIVHTHTHTRNCQRTITPTRARELAPSIGVPDHGYAGDGLACCIFFYTYNNHIVCHCRHGFDRQIHHLPHVCVLVLEQFGHCKEDFSRLPLRIRLPLEDEAPAEENKWGRGQGKRGEGEGGEGKERKGVGQL